MHTHTHTHTQTHTHAHARTHAHTHKLFYQSQWLQDGEYRIAWLSCQWKHEEDRKWLSHCGIKPSAVLSCHSCGTGGKDWSVTSGCSFAGSSSLNSLVAKRCWDTWGTFFRTRTKQSFAAFITLKEREAGKGSGWCSTFRGFGTVCVQPDQFLTYLGRFLSNRVEYE